MAELIDPSSFQDFTLQTLMTPDGVTRINNILRQLSQNISGDTESVRVFTGVGTPEASVAAGVGSLYMRTDGGADTSVYRKETGSGDTGWVAVKSPASLPLSVANGGFGADNSAVAQGYVPYMSATGIISWLAPGTSGQVLVTQGIAANPSWISYSGFSNVLFQYHGIFLGNVGVNNGEVVSGTITPAGKTGTYRYLIAPGASSDNSFRSKFIKVSGITTVTVWTSLWAEASGQADMSVDIGGVNGHVTGTSGQTTPEWKSFTIDVSSLTNGTSYDVVATLSDASGASKNAACGAIIGFGN